MTRPPSPAGIRSPIDTRGATTISMTAGSETSAVSTRSIAVLPPNGTSIGKESAATTTATAPLCPPTDGQRTWAGTLTPMIPTVGWAADLAETLLKDVDHRWPHVEGVARRAAEISYVVPAADRPYLVAAAYLHDIGYAPVLGRVGLHQLDGAAYLRWLGHERLARLVAHHSEARFEIELRGAGHLLAGYEAEDQRLRDALTYCDITTSPMGAPTTLTDRLAEIEDRYGSHADAVARQILEALGRSRPNLEQAVVRTERRIQAVYAGEPCRPYAMTALRPAR